MPTLTTSSSSKLPSRGSRGSTLEIMDVSLTEKRLECDKDKGNEQAPEAAEVRRDGAFLCNPAQA
jgi:hypothetical protein